MLIAAGLLLLAPLAKPFYQKHSQYLAAIRNTSTNTGYVYVTLVDGATGEVRSGCVAANALLGAIHREYRLGYDPRSSAKAVEIGSRVSHRFTFKTRAALANLSFQSFQRSYRAECAIILRGRSAWRGDIAGQLFEGD